MAEGDERNIVGSPPGRGPTGPASAAASRVKVDSSDITSLKGLLKDTATAAKTLADNLKGLNDSVPILKQVNAQLTAMRSLLGVAGGRSSVGGVSQYANSGAGAANQNAGPISAATVMGVGNNGGSYLPSGAGLAAMPGTPARVGGIPSVNLGGQPQQSMWQKMQSYTQQVSSARSTPGSYQSSQYSTGVKIGMGATDVGSAVGSVAGVAGSYLGRNLNTMVGNSQLVTTLAMGGAGGYSGGAYNRQYQTLFGGPGTRGALSNNLGQADVAQAAGSLGSLGAMFGQRQGQALSAINSFASLNRTAGAAGGAQAEQAISAPKNYYALRAIGINTTPGTTTPAQLYPELAKRMWPQMSGKPNSGQIQQLMQPGTFAYTDAMTFLGGSPQAIQDFALWLLQQKGGSNTTAIGNSLAGVAQQTAGQRGTLQSSVQARAAGGVAAGLRATQKGDQALTDATGTMLGGALLKVGGLIGALSQHINITNALLAKAALGGRLGGGGGILGSGGAAGEAGVATEGAEMGGMAGLGAVALPAAIVAGSLVDASLIHKDVSLVGQIRSTSASTGRAVTRGGYQSQFLAIDQQAHKRGRYTPQFQAMERQIMAAITSGKDPSALLRRAQSYALSGGGGATEPGSNSTGGGSASGSATSGGMMKAEQVIHTAERYLGTPYRWGGSTPRTGFDCSGLVQWSYGQAGVKLPRVAADQQKVGKPVNPADVAPGDLLFLGNPAYHVMMSIGGGKVIEAPHTGADVKIIPFPASGATDIKRVLGNVSPSGAIGASGGTTSSGGDSGDTTGATVMAGGALLGGALFGDSSTGGALQGALGALGGGVMVPTASSAGSSNAGAGGGGSATGPMPSGSAKQWINKALSILHMDSPRNVADVGIITSHESSNNPKAVNNWDSNAAAGHASEGIMQTIPSTFQAHALKGYGNIWNPIDNIIAGVRYAVGRYGSLDNVPGVKAVHAGGKYVGYETGKWELARDELAQLHRGEMVVPARTADNLRAAVAQAPQQYAPGARRTVPVTLVFKVEHATEGEMRKAAKSFVKFIEEDHDIDLVASG